MSLTVLIVDDSPGDAFRLRSIVRGAGHRALAADSGEQALAMVRAWPPDVVLMDVEMPDLDGFATTRRLKDDPRTRHVPIVFVTGKNRKADIAWGRMLGAQGYVCKPYTAAQIVAELERCTAECRTS
jgi:twitching motility two-component system response regulator PilH